MKPIKIVITGGPSGGKTTLVDALSKEFPETLSVVPEAATLLYKGGFPRSADAESKMCVQRAIYSVQKELETFFEKSSGKKLLLCDRGTLDGLAYWPRRISDFFLQVKTTPQREIKRYDWVIHLDTTHSKKSYNNNNSTFRTETLREAVQLNEKVRRVWKEHPQRIVVAHHVDFFKKITLAKQIIYLISQGKTWEEIQLNQT